MVLVTLLTALHTVATVSVAPDSVPDVAPAPSGDVRLMSYNIRRGLSMNHKMNLNGQIEVMRRWNPDFIMLQEVDNRCLRSRSINEAKVIAKSLGMHSTFAHAIRILWNKYGVAVISREKPLSIERYPLKCKSEKRVLLVCEFEDKFVACTHLSTKREENMPLVSILRAAAQKATKPFYIGGDWNATPNSELLDSLRQDFMILSDHYDFTFPAAAPDRCIDYIGVFKNESFSVPEVTFQCVADEPQVSDHRPLIVDVKERDCRQE